MTWKWIFTGGVYLFATAAFALLQVVENRVNGRHGPFWAPAWWVALTWPFWLVVIMLDLPVSWPGGHFGRARKP